MKSRRIVAATLVVAVLSGCGKSPEAARQDNPQAESEATMDDFYDENPSPGSVPNAATVQAACDKAETLEVACRENGTDCDVAEIARKQCDQLEDMEF